MIYSEIQTAAYTYADRTDQETIDRYDDFLRIVEARINRVITTLKMSARTTLAMDEAITYYGMPLDFLGFRDLRVEGTSVNGENATVTCQYRTPAQINELRNTTQISGEVYYSVISDQLHVYPPQDDTHTLEMVYYQKIPPLTSTEDTNWISEEHPDTYIFGLLVEINAFNKDIEATGLWETRFKEAVGDISVKDIDTRWGNSDLLVMRTI